MPVPEGQIQSILIYTSYISPTMVPNSHFSHLSLVYLRTGFFLSKTSQPSTDLLSRETYPKSAKINFVSYILIFRVSGCTRFGSPRIAKKFPKFMPQICFSHFSVAVFLRAKYTRVLRFHACIFKVFLHLTALHSFW